MLLFGHVGLTVGAARRLDPRADLRAPAVLSMLPDLIDKPVRVLWPALVHGSTRSFGHSLAGAAAALAVLASLPLGRRRTLVLWGCYAGHLVLDRMWLPDSVAVLLWPLRGPLPAPAPGPPFLESHLMLYNACGEALGLLILLHLAWRRI